MPCNLNAEHIGPCGPDCQLRKLNFTPADELVQQGLLATILGATEGALYYRGTRVEWVIGSRFGSGEAEVWVGDEFFSWTFG